MRILYFIILLSYCLYTQVLKVPSLEDIYKTSVYRAEMVDDITFVEKGNKFISISKNVLSIIETATGKILDSVVINSKIADFNNYRYDEDNGRILLEYAEEKIFRHSTVCKIAVYDIKNERFSEIDTSKVGVVDYVPENNSVFYIKGNDIFRYNMHSGSIEQITFDGKMNSIINGKTDWVNEEEFSFTKAYWVDPTGDILAYLKFDETNVSSYDLQIWGNENYPSNFSYKYPKAGERGSSAELWIYNLKTKSHKKIYRVQDGYLPRVGWNNMYNLSFFVLNRMQNQLKIFTYDFHDNNIKELYEEISNEYLDIDAHVLFDSKNIYFTSDRNGNKHIQQLNVESGKVVALTSGKWSVSDLVANHQNLLYFTKEAKFSRVASTVNIINKKITSFSDTNSSTEFIATSEKKVLLLYSSLTKVPKYLICNNDFSAHTTIVANKNLQAKCDSLSPIKVQFKEVPINGHYIKVCYLDDNNSSSIQEPVLIYQYSGPGFRLVLNEWKWSYGLWFRYLLGNGYKVALVDPIGSGGYDAKYQKSTYKNLGLKESGDIAAFARYIKYNEKDVDTSKVCVFGWSFGGFISSLCATKHSSGFHKSVAVAPVTNWRFYDNIYTERYMQTPDMNPSGYENTSVMKYVTNLSKTDFLLVHGTGDDNVHLQNTLELQEKLVNENKNFDMFLFKDKNHGLYGGNSRYFLFKKISDFLLKDCP